MSASRTPKPEASVLLPYRDARSTLDEALGSILDQRGVDFEVVAVDDGSTDGSAERVAAWAAGDPRIVAVRNDGRGLVAALNTAARQARGEILVRMDADDLALPTRLAKLVGAFAERPSLAAVGSRVEPFPEGAVGPGMRAYVDWQNALLTPTDHRLAIFVEAPLCHPSVALRASTFRAIGGYRDFAGPEDYDLYLRLCAAGHELAKIPEVLLHWRHREGRATFADPRYAQERFLETKAPHLARYVRDAGRPLVVWGAGPTGRRLARSLEPHGVQAARFVDIDPRKIGRMARGVAIAAPTTLRPGAEFVVAAVGARGARDLIRDALRAGGFVEGVDFVCAA